MMELLLVLGLLGALGLIAIGQSLWIWVGIIVALLVVGYRAYRIRCRHCGQSLISGKFLKYCSQCGAEQASPYRMRCQSCRRMVRHELNMNYCNRCGTPSKL